MPDHLPAGLGCGALLGGCLWVVVVGWMWLVLVLVLVFWLWLVVVVVVLGRLLERVGSRGRFFWAVGIVPRVGMDPRWPFQPALSAACLRRSFRSVNAGASRKRFPGDPISS